MCSCGNIPGALINNSFCNKPCDGDQNKICGSGSSPLHNSVFATGRWCNIKSNLWVKFLIIRRMSTPIDGGWSTWTSWSSCQSNCRQQRNRTCDSPTPLFGGDDCLGNKTELSPSLCYGDKCCPGKTLKIWYISYLLSIIFQLLLTRLIGPHRMLWDRIHSGCRKFR